MGKWVSVRVQPVSVRSAGGQRAHDLRHRVPGYVDRSKLDSNSIVLASPPAAEIRDEIAAARSAAGQQKLRQDARVAISGVITWSHEAQAIVNVLDARRQDLLHLRIAEAIERTTGHKLLGLVVHRDESAIHAHFTLRGYRTDESGREHPARFKPADLTRLQDVAGAVVGGLGITRGVPKAQRVAAGEPLKKTRHRNVWKLHQDLEEDAREALAEARALAYAVAKQRALSDSGGSQEDPPIPAPRPKG